MKIYEIIVEAPEAVSPGGIVIPAGAKTAAPVVTPPTTAYTAGNKAGKTFKAVKGAIANPSVQRVNELAKRVILRDKIGGATLETTMAKSLGGYLRLVKYFGFMQIAMELWTQKVAIDTLVAEKQITPEDGAIAYRQQVEKMVVAVMATAGFAKLIRGLRYVPLLKWLVRGGALVATGASFGTLGAPSVALALASEAGAIWFQNFLESPDGQKALASWVTYLIDPSVTWLYNQGPGKIFGEWKTMSDAGQEKVDAATQAATDKKTDTKTDQGAQPGANDSNSDVDSTSSPVTPGASSAKPTNSTDRSWKNSSRYSNLPSLDNITIK